MVRPRCICGKRKVLLGPAVSGQDARIWSTPGVVAVKNKAVVVSEEAGFAPYHAGTFHRVTWGLHRAQVQRRWQRFFQQQWVTCSQPLPGLRSAKMEQERVPSDQACCAENDLAGPT